MREPTWDIWRDGIAYRLYGWGLTLLCWSLRLATDDGKAVILQAVKDGDKGTR